MDPALDDDIADQLRGAIGALSRVVRAAVDEAPQPHLETLGVLVREGPRSIAEIARRRSVRHQSQSVTVSELLEAGQVERRRDPDDGRSVILTLTPAGREVLLRSRHLRAHWIAERSARLTSEERAILERVPGILQRLAEADETHGLSGDAP